jgi:hypothetical protein
MRMKIGHWRQDPKQWAGIRVRVKLVTKAFLD